jgi:putative beta-lysine N-acetyltransferase
MDFNPEDAPDILETLDHMAAREKYGKISAKVPASMQKLFLDNGYGIEAIIPEFYNGKEDGLFVGKFLDEKRAVETNISLLKDVLKKAQAKKQQRNGIGEPGAYSIRLCTPEDAGTMAEIYKDVFLTYPFPFDNSEYLNRTMNET